MFIQEYFSYNTCFSIYFWQDWENGECFPLVMATTMVAENIFSVLTSTTRGSVKVNHCLKCMVRYSVNMGDFSMQNYISKKDTYQMGNQTTCNNSNWPEIRCFQNQRFNSDCITSQDIEEQMRNCWHLKVTKIPNTITASMTHSSTYIISTKSLSTSSGALVTEKFPCKNP